MYTYTDGPFDICRAPVLLISTSTSVKKPLRKAQIRIRVINNQLQKILIPNKNTIFLFVQDSDEDAEGNVCTTFSNTDQTSQPLTTVVEVAEDDMHTKVLDESNSGLDGTARKFRNGFFEVRTRASFVKHCVLKFTVELMWSTYIEYYHHPHHLISFCFGYSWLKN